MKAISILLLLSCLFILIGFSNDLKNEQLLKDEMFIVVQKNEQGKIESRAFGKIHIQEGKPYLWKPGQVVLFRCDCTYLNNSGSAGIVYRLDEHFKLKKIGTFDLKKSNSEFQEQLYIVPEKIKSTISEKDRAIEWITKNNRWGINAPIIDVFAEQLENSIANNINVSWKIGWGATKSGKAYFLGWVECKFRIEELSVENAKVIGFEEMEFTLMQATESSTVKLLVEKDVMDVINSWNDQYVMLTHSKNPIIDIKDFKGKEILVFYGYGLTRQQANEFIKAIGYTADDVMVALQNNWDVYPKQFLEANNRIAFLANIGADILLEDPNVKRIEFYSDIINIEKKIAIDWIKENNRFGPESDVVKTFISMLETAISNNSGDEWWIGWGLTKSNTSFEFRWINGIFYVNELTHEEALEKHIQEMKIGGYVNVDPQ